MADACDVVAALRGAEAEWFDASEQLEKDSPEFLAAYAKYRAAGRAVRNHYASVSDRKFGRI